jgi:hypothetical protein
MHIEVTIQSHKNFANMKRHVDDLLAIHTALARRLGVKEWGTIARNGITRTIETKTLPSMQDLMHMIHSYFDEALATVDGAASVRLEVIDDEGQVVEIMELGYSPKSA